MTDRIPDTTLPLRLPNEAAAATTATTTDSNADIVNALFDEKLQLHNKPAAAATSDDDHGGHGDDADADADDNTSESSQTTAAVDLDAADEDAANDADKAENAAEAKRRAEELTLSADELAERLAKATEIKTFGNLQFRNEEWANSVESYTEGLAVCPLAQTEQRAVLLGNRAAAHIQMGDTTRALADCSRALELSPDYMKVLLRRAKLYEDTDKLDESLADFERAVKLNGDCAEARLALVRLPPKIDERNQKLKDEMLGKLKDLGNMILRPFGLSTNNFQMKQDPATGSYSVNFNQNQK